MRLKTKVLLTIGLIWLAFLAITYTGSHAFLKQRFLALEQQFASQDVSRVREALKQDHRSLFTFTYDWSHWNDLYSYMQGKNPAFVRNNLTMSAYVNGQINLILFFNKSGKVVLGTGIDTEQQKRVPYPQGLIDYLYPGSPLLSINDVNKGLQGFIQTPKGIMLIAASPITDSRKERPAIGTLVTGRYLSPTLLSQLAQITHLNIHLLLPAEIAKIPHYQQVFQQFKQTKLTQMSEPAAGHGLLEAFTVIKDINGQPIGMIRLTLPRSIFLSGLRAINYYLSSFVLLGALFSLIAIWALRKLIVQRLERLNSQVAQITEKNQLAERVDVEGHDELTSVASQINKMLASLQGAQDVLEKKVLERTRELQLANNQLQQEISDRKAVEKELLEHKEHLVRLAHYDALTSLPNRVFFNEILNKAIAHAKRHDKVLAILFIDLDRFKTINDAMGHSIGDMVLKEIGNRFAKLLRAGDVLARLGGDEFIVLLNDIGYPKFAGPVAEKIIQACAQPVQVGGHEFFVTVSIGICIFPYDGDSLEDLQKNADMAMYKAKHLGGSIYQYYTHAMDVAAHEHIKLETALRKAIQNNELVLYFQPQLKVRTGKITRLEALIRWDHPELGIINPADFIPLAEETGLISAIGEWSLREACRINKQWQDEGYDPVVVAVNLSSKQFRQQNVAQMIAKILEETKLQARYLEIEITESAIMDNVDQVIERLNQIKAMGIQIAIDDFGTGYTSISYLKKFPITGLKIDQSFIKGIPQNQNDMAITTAVIALAHNLGLEVVAEGVETTEQMHFLTEHNCDAIQGYFISRPLQAQKVVSQLSKQGQVQEDTVV